MNFKANRLCTIGFDMFTNNSSIESTHVHFVHFAIYANHWNSTERGGGGSCKRKVFFTASKKDGFLSCKNSLSFVILMHRLVNTFQFADN